jgi:hypothetical protein
VVNGTGAAPGGSTRRPWVWLSVAGLLVVAALVALQLRPGPAAPEPTTAAPSGPDAGSTPTLSATRAPDLVAPPAVCGSPALDGPASPPDGAVVVATTEDLSTVTAQNPAGTTFWLEPGRHTLGAGQFAQVLPKSGNRYVGAPGAVLDGARTNRYAFGGDNNEGVVNHDAAPGWRMSNLTVRGNAGAGVFLGDGNLVEDSCLADNGQYGFSVYSPDGVEDVTLRGNEITGNNTDDWERRIPGCGCTGGGKFWETTGARLVDNHVHDNRGPGFWADTNNAGFTVVGNHVADNDGPGLMYETSYNAAIVGNTFIGNGRETWRENPGFPTAAVYVSESGSDPRVDTPHAETFEIAQNLFVDNWGGVVAWENADRFAGSPANTSTGSTTLVNPEATLEACTDPDVVGTEPYIDDCRWKTQHLRVHDNVFRFSPDALGPECTEENVCGFSGLFSNYGTFPPWSPYQGTVVEEAVTFEQDNLWYDNTYEGPWGFVVVEMGTEVGPGEWQDSPYEQDRGSTFDE